MQPQQPIGPFNVLTKEMLYNFLDGYLPANGLLAINRVCRGFRDAAIYAVIQKVKKIFYTPSFQPGKTLLDNTGPASVSRKPVTLPTEAEYDQDFKVSGNKLIIERLNSTEGGKNELEIWNLDDKTKILSIPHSQTGKMAWTVKNQTLFVVVDTSIYTWNLETGVRGASFYGVPEGCKNIWVSKGMIITGSQEKINQTQLAIWHAAKAGYPIASLESQGVVKMAHFEGTSQAVGNLDQLQLAIAADGIYRWKFEPNGSSWIARLQGCISIGSFIQDVNTVKTCEFIDKRSLGDSETAFRYCVTYQTGEMKMFWTVPNLDDLKEIHQQVKNVYRLNHKILYQFEDGTVRLIDREKKQMVNIAPDASWNKSVVHHLAAKPLLFPKRWMAYLDRKGTVHGIWYGDPTKIHRVYHTAITEGQYVVKAKWCKSRNQIVALRQSGKKDLETISIYDYDIVPKGPALSAIEKGSLYHAEFALPGPSLTLGRVVRKVIDFVGSLIYWTFYYAGYMVYGTLYGTAYVIAHTCGAIAEIIDEIQKGTRTYVDSWKPVSSRRLPVT